MVTPKFILVAENIIKNSPDRKIDIEGVFNVIFAPSYPAIHKRLFVFVGMEFKDVGASHREQVKILSKDGKRVISETDEITLVVEKNIASAVHEMRNILFPERGEYKVVLYIDRREVVSTPLEAQVS